MTHISYSEFKTWSECPWKHKLAYIERISNFNGNEYTAFGTAIHDVCDKKELEKLPEEYEENQKLIKDMFLQANNLIPDIQPGLKRYFGKHKIISAEEKLYEPIKDIVEVEYNFKGFIDLVLQTEDGKYHIIDWKTCSWGWDARKKSNKLIVYQLILYKYYFAIKYDIDPANIETHFALLKRTAKKNNVEFFRVTSGKKRMENALKALENSLYYINRKFSIKNRLSCRYCEFYKTEHCR
jgi:ATP-dependent exoDNAse (exonuclease V) beta subunit